MPQQPQVSVENNFTAGLKTEFTGLNFPENACTDVDNCVFDLIGNVTRRGGIDYEALYQLNTLNVSNYAVSTYVWNNAGGDGNSKVLVAQVGPKLYFFGISSATAANPLSQQLGAQTVDLNAFVTAGSTAPETIECQFTDGNGYLFVFHPSLNPFYCTFLSGNVTPNQINIQIRDFAGIPEPGVQTTLRPTTLTAEHQYNLQNQGWTQGSAWVANSSTFLAVILGSRTFTIQSGLSISPGQLVQAYAYVPGEGTVPMMAGNVTSYSGTTLVINCTSIRTPYSGIAFTPWTIIPYNIATIDTWKTQLNNYPSNADVWWYFKNSSDVFAPGTTVQSVTLSSGPAPKGYYVIDAFGQQRSLVSAVPGLTDVTTNKRPKTGAWYQGRVWYAGVDGSQSPTGDEPFYTWTENIYFSQIVTSTQQFGYCFQNNDPTSENLFGLLPTDGGVIQIQGCGSIYKLFPMQNGMLVFAENGVWVITGGQALGFTANDYTISKVSSVKSVSGSSFVDVLGYPTFWNNEGIYAVSNKQDNAGPYGGSGGFVLENLCMGTILSYYNDIPQISKRYAKGTYNPLDYEIKWIFRSTNEAGIIDRYKYDRVLTFNVHNKAFYPYSVTGTPSIHAINFIQGTGAINGEEPSFKFLTSTLVSGIYKVTFSEERDVTHYKDWYSYDATGVNYISSFETGYRIKGQAQRLFQPEYVYMYLNTPDSSYKIQGIWNYANTGNSGKYSSIQLVVNDIDNFDKMYRRHRIRGHGVALQLKVTSVDGQPFDIMGWSILDQANAGV